MDWRPVALLLIRHGETEWSRSRRHTGRTDVPLTATGEGEAADLGRRLAGTAFSAVWTSPAARARATARLAGLTPDAVVLDDLAEFDYGAYEGLTTREIARTRPGWDLWRDGGDRGESPGTVLQRARRALATIAAGSRPGTVAVVSHGHLLRALAVAYLGLPVEAAGGFMLEVASISILDAEHGQPAVRLWNLAPPTALAGAVLTGPPPPARAADDAGSPPATRSG
ncbi:MAG TPA: histidine phosphatase family protein [Verrucomicrobiae bacterium]|nr:histidine phosphatase family protein [Verrucomicrobiae bacterium]